MAKYIPKSIDNFGAFMGELAGKYNLSDIDPNLLTQQVFNFMTQSVNNARQEQKADEIRKEQATRQNALMDMEERKLKLTEDKFLLEGLADFANSSSFTDVTPDYSNVTMQTTEGNMLLDSLVGSQAIEKVRKSNISNIVTSYTNADTDEAKAAALGDLGNSLVGIKQDTPLYKNTKQIYDDGVEKLMQSRSVNALYDNAEMFAEYFGVPINVFNAAAQKSNQAMQAGDFDMAKKIFNDTIATGGGNLQGQRDLSKSMLDFLGTGINVTDKLMDSYGFTEQDTNTMFKFIRDTIFSQIPVSAKNSMTDGVSTVQLLQSDEYSSLYNYGKIVSGLAAPDAGITENDSTFVFEDKRGNLKGARILPNGQPDFTALIDVNTTGYATPEEFYKLLTGTIVK
tara:strand:- start:322 stop:1512 length:1191 start_codon:yes stop_codon:yes gene_type:complete